MLNFVVVLRFVQIYALFGRFGAKKCFFWTTTLFLKQEVYFYMVYNIYYILYGIKFANLQFNSTRKNDEFVA